MKKNKLFRLLTLALTLVFLCQFAVPAFAATSDPWTDGSSTYYLVTTRTGYYTRSNAAIETATVSHTKGYSTYLPGYYDLGYTDASWNCDYGSDVRSTAAQDGYDDYHYESGVQMYTGTVEHVPSTAASGTYCIKTDVSCHRIGFDVYQDGIIYTSGEVYAPYGFNDLITGYKAV